MTFNVVDMINQYTLLSVPFMMLVGVYCLSKINMGEH